jgi:hypothetical protein
MYPPVTHNFFPSPVPKFLVSKEVLKKVLTNRNEKLQKPVVFCRQMGVISAIPQGGGPLAQLVEQLTLNQWVVGSNPTGPTKKTKGFQGISKTTPHFRQAYGEQNEKFRFSLSLN